MPNKILVGVPNELFGRSTDLSPQQLINCVVMSAPNNTRSVNPIYTRPGRTTEVTLATTVIRGGAVSQDGTELYVVSGNKFYEISTSFVATERGTLSSSTGRVDIIAGLNNVGIKNLTSTDGYEFIPSTNTFSTVVDADFPNLISMSYFDTYPIGVDSSFFWVGTSDDFSDWDALNFTADSVQADPLKQIIANNRKAWLLGYNTTTPWYNSGDVFPFDRNSTTTQIGVESSHAANWVDNNIWFIGRNEKKLVSVCYSEGEVVRELNCPNVNQKLGTLTRTDIDCHSFELDGQKLIIWEFPTSNFTLCYNVSSGHFGQWQDVSANYFGMRFAVNFAGKIVIGDTKSGKIESLSFATAGDTAGAFNWTIRTPNVYGDNKRYFCHRLELDYEAGTSTNTVTMGQSIDGGNNFVNNGAVADSTTLFDNQIMWASLDSGNMHCFELTGTSATLWHFFNLIAEFAEGDWY